MPVIKKNYHLLFKTWSAGKKIFKGEFNISTPLYGKYVKPNVMLVPLLAFDKKKIDLVMVVDFMIERFYIYKKLVY